MKRFLLLLLAALCLFAFVACEKKPISGSGSPSGNPDEEAATKVVRDFFDAFSEFDAEGMADCVNDRDAMAELIDKMDIDVLYDSMMENIPAEMAPFENEFEDLLDVIVDMLLDTISYRIERCEANGDDRYVFDVEITHFDERIDFEELLSESIADEFTEEAMMELIYEMMEEGKISETMTEEEAIALVLPRLFDRVEDALKTIKLDTVISDAEISVVKTKGAWLIDAEESSFE